MRAEAGLAKQSKRIRLHHRICTKHTHQPQVCYRYVENQGKRSPADPQSPLFADSIPTAPSRALSLAILHQPLLQPARPQQAQPGLAWAARQAHEEFWPSSLWTRAPGPCSEPSGRRAAIGSRRNAAMERCLLKRGELLTAARLQRVSEPADTARVLLN